MELFSTISTYRLEIDALGKTIAYAMGTSSYLQKESNYVLEYALQLFSLIPIPAAIARPLKVVSTSMCK